jgi:hypothetical protein
MFALRNEVPEEYVFGLDVGLVDHYSDAKPLAAGEELCVTNLNRKWTAI